MDSELLDKIHENLPTDLYLEITRERREEQGPIPASIFTEARNLLDQRHFDINSTEDEDLIRLFEILPKKLSEILDSGTANASHFKEIRVLLDHPLYFKLRQKSRIRDSDVPTIDNLLEFDETLGGVYSPKTTTINDPKYRVEEGL